MHSIYNYSFKHYALQNQQSDVNKEGSRKFTFALPIIAI